MRFPEPVGNTVWHYTDAGGVLGILNPNDAKAQAKRMGLPESKLPMLQGAFSMRFTDARYLNDPMELRFGAEILAESLAAATEAATELDDDDAEELNGVIAWLRDIHSDPSAIYQRPGGVYVACFSADQDSLSQWRGYAGRPGYAIGFDSNQIHKQLFPPIAAQLGHAWEADIYGKPIVAPVVYGEAQTRERFEQIARDLVGPPILFIAPGKPLPRQVLAEAALAGVKQHAYEVEHEVRAFILVGPTPLHREVRAGSDRSLGIIPYITASRILSGGPHGLQNLITEIMVGPGEDVELRRQAVEQAVEMYVRPGAITVTASGFRFRA